MTDVLKTLDKLRKEYRPTMDKEVLQSWAEDVGLALQALNEFVIIEYAVMADDGTPTLVRRPQADMPAWVLELGLRDGMSESPTAREIMASEFISYPYPPDGPAAVFENRVVSEDGKLVDIDFAKIEERVLAHHYSSTLTKLIELAEGKADCRPLFGDECALLPDVDPDKDLLGQGEFDSLGIVEFMLTCEDEFKGLKTDAQEDFKVFSGPLKDLATWIVGKVPYGG